MISTPPPSCASSSPTGGRHADDLDGGGDDQVALTLIRAIAGDEQATTLVLNVRNAPHCPPWTPTRWWRCRPCLVGRSRAHPLDVGSRAGGVKALAIHPLGGSVRTAERILDRELEALPELRSVRSGD